MMPQATNLAPLMISPARVAILLGVSPRTLWRLAATGKIPQPIRYSRKLVRWKAADIAAYVAAIETQPRPAIA